MIRADARKTPLTEDTALYALMNVVATTGFFTVEKPVCGAEVKVVENPWFDQLNGPVVFAAADSHLDVPVMSYARPIWVDNRTDMPLDGVTLVGGTTYKVLLEPVVKFWYVVDTSHLPEITVAGADEGSLDISRLRFSEIYFTVTAEHDWGAWEVVEEPTVEAEGLRRRTCNACDAVEEEPIEKLEPEPIPEPEPDPEPEPAPASKPSPNVPATGEPASIAGFLSAIGGALMQVSAKRRK